MKTSEKLRKKLEERKKAEQRVVQNATPQIQEAVVAIDSTAHLMASTQLEFSTLSQGVRQFSEANIDKVLQLSKSKNTKQAIAKGVELYEPVRECYVKGEKLLKKNPTQAMKEFQQAVQKAEQGNLIDMEIIIRTQIITYYLRNYDFENALLHVAKLDANLNQFERNHNLEHAKILGSNLTLELKTNAHVCLAKSFFYLGEFEKAELHFQKIKGALLEWQADTFDQLENLFSILNSRARKLLKNNNNNNNKNNFIIISKILTKIENDCLEAIKTANVDGFKKAYNDFASLNSFYSIYFDQPISQEYWIHFSILPNQLAEMEFKIGAELLKTPDFGKKVDEKIDIQIVALVGTALDLARDLQNPTLILSCSSLLVDYYKNKMEQNKEDKESREKYDYYLRIKQQQEKYAAELKAQQAEREARRQELERLEKESANQDINDNPENSSQPETVELSQDDLYSKGIKLLDNGQIDEAQYYLLQAKDGENSVVKLKALLALAECKIKQIDSEINFAAFRDQTDTMISLFEFHAQVKQSLMANNQNIGDVEYADTFFRSPNHPENRYITYFLESRMDALLLCLVKNYEYIESALFNLADSHDQILKTKNQVSNMSDSYQAFILELQEKIKAITVYANLINDIVLSIQDWLSSKHEMIKLLIENDMWFVSTTPSANGSRLTQLNRKLGILLDSEREIQNGDEFKVKNYAAHINNLAKQAAKLSPQQQILKTQEVQQYESSREPVSRQKRNNSKDNFSIISTKFTQLQNRAADLLNSTNDNCNDNITLPETSVPVETEWQNNLPDTYEEVNKIVDLEKKQTLIHKAVLENSRAKVLALFKRNIDIDVQDSEGNTPAHLAALHGFHELYDFLSLKGADVNIENNRGMTALHYRNNVPLARISTFDRNELPDTFANDIKRVTKNLIQNTDSFEKAETINAENFKRYKLMAKNYLNMEMHSKAYDIFVVLLNAVINQSLGDSIDAAYLCDQLNYCLGKIAADIEEDIKYEKNSNKYYNYYSSLVSLLTSQIEYCERTIALYDNALQKNLIPEENVAIIIKRSHEVAALIPKINAARTFYQQQLNLDQNLIAARKQELLLADLPKNNPQDIKATANNLQLEVNEKVSEEVFLESNNNNDNQTQFVVNSELLHQINMLRFKPKQTERVVAILKQILQEIEIYAKGDKEKYQTALNSCKLYTGETLLHVAAAYGFVGLVDTLLEHGADVNALDKNEHSVVFLAALKGHLEITKKLVEHGGDYLRANRWKSSPLHVAASNGHLAIVEYLVNECKENKDRLDGNNRTAFQLSVMNSRASVTAANPVTNFFINGAKAQGNPLPTYVNMKDSKNNTALHLAIMCVKDNFAATCTSIEKLLQAGADINAKNSKDYTPAELVFKFKNLNADDKFKLIKLMVEHSKNKVDLTYCEKHLTAGDLAKLNMKNVRGISEKRFEIVRAMQHEAQKRAQMIPKR